MKSLGNENIDSANSLCLIFDNVDGCIECNESDDDLPLGKTLNISVCIIAVGSVFKEGNNYYPQANLHKCSYEREC